jgi:4-hydroxybenzoate polyprenyltransferase
MNLRLQEILESSRLPVSAIAGTSAAITLISGGHASHSVCLAAMISFTCVTMAGFLMNDLYDREKDKIAGKARPIATGKLPVENAFFAILLISGLASFILWLGFGVFGLLCAFTLLVALAFYSPTSHNFPLLKGIYTALLCISPTLFGLHFGGSSMLSLAIPIVVSYIIFREIVLDGNDLETDLQFGLKTPAYYLGKRHSSNIGWIGMFITLVAALIVSETTYAAFAFGLAIIIQCFAFIISHENNDRAMNITRISMLLGTFGLALGA